MAKKKTRKERPFRPADPDALKPLRPGQDDPTVPTCGVGTSSQVDVHNFSLFDVPTRDSGVYFRELVQLTKKLNDVFRREARPYLHRMQKEHFDKSIQLTIALHKGGLYLTYAKPFRKRAKPR
jgi:hypothetical protein